MNRIGLPGLGIYKLKLAATKEAMSVAALMRLAQRGAANSSQLAQLTSKMHSGKNRMLNTLTANPKNPGAIYNDVRTKFQNIGRGNELNARVRNLGAQKPNVSWDTLNAQIAPFQRDFRAIKGQMTANGQNPWAENGAIRQMRHYAKQRATAATSNYGKAVSQPNIHKSLFAHPESTANEAIFGAAKTVSGRPTHVNLFPQINQSAIKRNYAIFHEGGHGLDQNLRQMRDMQHMQKTFRGARNSWNKNINGLRDKSEAFADGFAGNSLVPHTPMQPKPMPMNSAAANARQDAINFSTEQYNSYGGGRTGTTIPSGYHFNATNNPYNDTTRLMSTLGINSTPTMRTFGTTPLEIDLIRRAQQMRQMQQRMAGFNVR